MQRAKRGALLLDGDGHEWLLVDRQGSGRGDARYQALVAQAESRIGASGEPPPH
jgi:hypothetical protein